MSERCANPICNVDIILSKHAAVKRFCSNRCRGIGWALRQAKAIMGQTGVVRFVAILDAIPTERESNCRKGEKHGRDFSNHQAQ